MDCGNYMDARDRIIPFIFQTGESLNLLLIIVTYNSGVHVEISWQKEIGKHFVNDQLEIEKFQASLTHAHILYKGEFKIKFCQKIM